MRGKRAADHGRVREALSQAFRQQQVTSNGPNFDRETSSFCDNPGEYDWQYCGKREMFVPYNCGVSAFLPAPNSGVPAAPMTLKTRWEKRRVWVVEGVLLRGESNTLARRRFYLDEESWLILLGEGFDHSGLMTKCFMFYKDAFSADRSWGQWYSTVDSDFGST